MMTNILNTKKYNSCSYTIIKKKKKKKFQPVKVDRKISKFYASAVMYKGKVYVYRKQIIDINHFKTTSKLDTLPTRGAELTALVSLFNYFMDYMPCLSYLNKDMLKMHSLRRQIRVY